MELDEAMKKRTSVRKFTNEPVSDTDIDALMHAAMMAPSAMDKRPWDYYVIKDSKTLEDIQKHGSKWANYGAPLAIVVVCSLSKALPFEFKEFWIQDCSAATENILLKASDLGLGAVWCGVHPIKSNVENVQKILSLGTKEIPLNIILVGHPKQDVKPKDKYDKKRIHII